MIAFELKFDTDEEAHKPARAVANNDRKPFGRISIDEAAHKHLAIWK